MAFNYWCKLRGNKPVILFRMSAEGGEEVLNMDGWGPAPGSYEDILEGSFDYQPIGEKLARDYFPKGFAEG
jgi:hypothetical protein